MTMNPTGRRNNVDDLPYPLSPEEQPEEQRGDPPS